MFKKILTMLMMLALIGTPGSKASEPYAQGSTETTLAGKVKSRVAEFSDNDKTRVKVRLRNKTNLKGYISKVDADEFSLTDARTGATTTIAYADVTTIKKQNLSKKAKAGIGVAIGVGGILVFFAIVTRGGTRRLLD